MTHPAAASRELRLLAAAGDLWVILAFAAIGRSSHHARNSDALLATVGTAAPFLVGWFACAMFGGVYADDALDGRRPAATRVLRAWVPGCLVGCAMRSVLERHLTPVSFVVIAFGFNGVLLTAWHVLLASLRTRRRPAA